MRSIDRGPPCCTLLSCVFNQKGTLGVGGPTTPSRAPLPHQFLPELDTSRPDAGDLPPPYPRAPRRHARSEASHSHKRARPDRGCLPRRHRRLTKSFRQSDRAADGARRGVAERGRHGAGTWRARCRTSPLSRCQAVVAAFFSPQPAWPTPFRFVPTHTRTVRPCYPAKLLRCSTQSPL